MCFMVAQFAVKTQYQRERRRNARKLVTEIFSPPRITKRLCDFPSMKLAPGFALDLTTTDPDDGEPWDFGRACKRQKARRLISEQKPLFVIGSPDCTAFSSWQALNRVRGDAAELDRKYAAAMIHLRFCCEVYKDQIDAGRYFLHEHPSGARSWGEECVKK